MEIVSVEKWLLQSVDEDESEAVALSCVEFLLSETNALFAQKTFAQKAIRAASRRLRDNVLDSVFASTLAAEIALNDRFGPENPPEAEQKDRFAVRSVPSKSPEKVHLRANAVLAKTSSPASSNPKKLLKRRKKSKGELEKRGTEVVPVQIIEREGNTEDENAEIKQWRDKCLKTLEASTRKPGFARFVTVARAFAVPESPVSMEMGVIVAPSSDVFEAMAATPIHMKTNVDSFSSILDASGEFEEVPAVTSFTKRTSRRPSTILDFPGRSLQPMSTAIHSVAEKPQHQSKRSQAENGSELALQLQRKTTLLTDSLSRRKLTRRPSCTESLSGNSINGSSRNLWLYESDAGNTTSRTFVADGAAFDATSLPATMNVAAGVVLQQGESVVEGPEWVDGATTMSRKRFDLQQRLATDALLNASSEHNLHSPQSLSLGSPLQFGHYPTSPLSELHFRDYEEVPPEPIPIPQLSPISTAIPRTHLTPSLSTPALRVRTTAFRLNSSVKEDTSGNDHRICTNSSGSNSLGSLKPRPTTALRTVAGSPKFVSGRTRATSAAPGNARASMKSAGTASAKYLREFPKPKPGVVRVVNDQAVDLLSSGDDRQRTAWMS